MLEVLIMAVGLNLPWTNDFFFPSPCEDLEENVRPLIHSPPALFFLFFPLLLLLLLLLLFFSNWRY